ncbi:acyltransferase [bacterium endosymbiont of Escarpia laminata]|nr:MAG: acyltransferase [bacterium endosymbiont of Escarpia laminata]
MQIKDKQRYYEIDLLRFLAAVAVVFFHYTFRGFAANDMSILPFPVLSEVFKYGALGVDLFFIISGFVILMTAVNKDYTAFVISRITRIYPAFWASVTLTALVIVFIGGDRYQVTLSQYIYNLPMISGFFDIKFVDGVYWSLLVEIKFYFLIFLLVLANKLKWIKYFLGLWLVLTLVNVFHEMGGVLGFFFFPKWSAYFIAGAMYFIIRQEGPSIYKVAVIALCLYISLFQAFERADVASVHFNTDFSRVTTGIVITGFYVLFGFIGMGKTKWINKKVFIFYGALTYPLYLIHQNIGFMIFNSLGEIVNKYVLLVGVIALTLYLAFLINKHVERRFGRPFKNLLTVGAERLIPATEKAR